MEKIYNSELQQRLERYIEETQISQAKLAPKIGISQTALSCWRRNQYEGDINALERKIGEFLRAEDARKQQAAKAAPYLPVLEYIPTSISEDVCSAITYCQIERGMVILHAPEVEYGHRKAGGRGYVPGRHMMELSLIEVQARLTPFLRQWLHDFINEHEP